MSARAATPHSKLSEVLLYRSCAERWRSPAAGSGSDGGADAGGSQVQRLVRPYAGDGARRLPVVHSDQGRVQVEIPSPLSSSSPRPGILDGPYQGGTHGRRLEALGGGSDHEPAEVAERE